MAPKHHNTELVVALECARLAKEALRPENRRHVNECIAMDARSDAFAEILGFIFPEWEAIGWNEVADLEVIEQRIRSLMS